MWSKYQKRASFFAIITDGLVVRKSEEPWESSHGGGGTVAVVIVAIFHFILSSPIRTLVFGAHIPPSHCLPHTSFSASFSSSLTPHTPPCYFTRESVFSGSQPSPLSRLIFIFFVCFSFPVFWDLVFGFQFSMVG